MNPVNLNPVNLKPVNLKSLFLQYGINSKTNFDIYDICKDLKLECFICMRDEIRPPGMRDEIRDFVPVATRIPESMSNERSPDSYESLIFNYQTTSEYGSHWCCFSNEGYSTKGGPTGLYFDSFGIKPIKELESRTLKYNDTQIQPFETEICGILSIYFLYLVTTKNDSSANKKLEFESIIEIMKKEVLKCLQ